MTGEIIANRTGEAYGDGCGAAPSKHCYRLFGVNLEQVPPYRREEKSKVIFRTMQKHGADALLGQETGRNWRNMPQDEQWRERCIEAKLFRPAASLIAYNTNEATALQTNKQFGGVVLTTVNDLTARLSSSDKDDTNLGRWTSMLFEGSNDHKTRLVTAYRPCKGGEIGSVYSQHQRYFRAKGEFTCPRKLFITHFSKQLKKWHDAGERIIVHLDANENLLNDEGDMSKMFETNGMYNPIFALHRTTKGTPPATQNRNTNGANIDGFYVSHGMEVIRGGYFAHGEGIWSTHTTQFIDVSKSSLLGKNPPDLNRVFPTRLDPTDPRSRDKYNELANKGFAPHDFHNQVADMRKMVATYVKDRGVNLDEIIALHHKLGTLNIEVRLAAAQKTKKANRRSSAMFGGIYQGHGQEGPLDPNSAVASEGASVQG
jgi:hypothetical protein